MSSNNVELIIILFMVLTGMHAQKQNPTLPTTPSSRRPVLHLYLIPPRKVYMSMYDTTVCMIAAIFDICSRQSQCDKGTRLSSSKHHCGVVYVHEGVQPCAGSALHQEAV